MYFWTHYLTESEAVDVVRAAGLRASFRHSKELYLRKVRTLLRMQRKDRYHADGSTFADAVAVKLLRYLSSVTLVVEKDNAY
jgi:hypothetical protein